MGQREVTVRERIPADLPVLAEVLEEQQPHTGYPQRWPLPSPVEEFLTRPGELGAWVATLDDDPAPVGHVSVTTPGSGPEVDGWVAAVGRPAEELAAVSVLFVDHRVSGRGVGGALLDAAVAFIRESGRARSWTWCRRRGARCGSTSDTAGGWSARRARGGCPPTTCRCCS